VSAIPSELSPAVRRLLPWLVAIAFFMEALDTTILNTAVPIVAKAIGTTPLAMKAVLASYTLSLAVFIPVSGWMADRYGTRRVFASAIGVFTLGSALCGLMSNVHWLVVCRILQGCGGAMMVPVGRLTLVRTFPKSQLLGAMNFVAIPAWIAPMIGPAAGGFIVAYLHWRAIFFLNIPVGVAGLWFVWRMLPDYRERTHALDIIGLILFGAGLALLSYVLEVFGEHSLSASEILGLLAVSLVLLFGYGVHAERTRWPLLRLGLYRIRTFAVAVGGGFITRLGIGGVPFLLPLLYQVGLGFSPVQSGLLIAPQAAAGLSSKIIIAPLLRRYGYRRVLIGNTLLMSVFLMLFATIGIGTPVWLIVTQALIYGALTSTQYTSMNTLTFADVSAGKASAASSLSSTSQQLSISFAVAVAGLVTMAFVPEAQRSQTAEMIGGLHRAFLALGAFTLVSTVVFWRLKPEDGADETRQKDIHLG